MYSLKNFLNVIMFWISNPVVPNSAFNSYLKFQVCLIDLPQSDIQILYGLQIDNGIQQRVSSSWTGIFNNNFVVNHSLHVPPPCKWWGSLSHFSEGLFIVGIRVSTPPPCSKTPPPLSYQAPPLKSPNCPSPPPLFKQFPPLYWFFVNPLP